MPPELGVHVTPSRIGMPSTVASTACPVFIGFTGTGELAQLHAIDSWARYVQSLGGAHEAQPEGAPHSVLYHTVRHYFDNGGGPCFIAVAGHYGALGKLGKGEIATALLAPALFEAIFNQPTITLLAIPDAVLIGTESDGEPNKMGEAHAQLWASTLEQCRAHPRIFCLFDAPRKPTEASTCLASLYGDRLGFAAAYWPHLITDYVKPGYVNSAERVDPLERLLERFFVVPPCGALAAVVQHVDRDHGVWRAPANMPLLHVVKPEHGYQDGDQLFDVGGRSINLLRSFVGRGLRAWGCRTLDNERGSLWQYVQVRRLVSYIEMNLEDIARFAVFEPNNQITWLKLKGLFTAWLRKLWLGGGLFGQQETQAFQILVGLGESMTEAELRAGQLIMKVRVAPLYPAEFIDINLEFNLSESRVFPSDSLVSRSAFL